MRKIFIQVQLPFSGSLISQNVEAHIPLETTFALAIQRGETGNNQHKIYMANVKPTRICSMRICPTQTIFHWLMLGLALGHWGSCWVCQGPLVGSGDLGVGLERLFRYLHVGITNANCSRWVGPQRGQLRDSYALQ